MSKSFGTPLFVCSCLEMILQILVTLVFFAIFKVISASNSINSVQEVDKELSIGNEVLAGHPFSDYFAQTIYDHDKLVQVEKQVFFAELERISDNITESTERYFSLLRLLYKFYHVNVKNPVDPLNRIHCNYLFRAAANNSELVLRALIELESFDPNEMAMKVNHEMGQYNPEEANRVLKQSLERQIYYYSPHPHPHKALSERIISSVIDFRIFDNYFKSIAEHSDYFRKGLFPIQEFAIFDVLTNPNTPERLDFYLLAVKHSYEKTCPAELFPPFKTSLVSLIYTTIHDMLQLNPSIIKTIFGSQFSIMDLEAETMNYFKNDPKTQVTTIVLAGHVPTVKLWLKYNSDKNSIDELFIELTRSYYPLTDECIKAFLDTVGLESLTQKQKVALLTVSAKNGHTSLIKYILNQEGVVLN